MRKRLTTETENATMTERFAQHDASIVDEELHGEIVCAINDEVPRLDNLFCIG